MIVYYSILAVILYCGATKKLSEKYENSENIFLFIMAITLCFFAAVRSIKIGADTDQYCSHFLHISNTKWTDLIHYYNKENYYGDIEFGYKIYNKLLSIFKNQQVITIANSILQISLISIVIVKQSKDKWLSFFLYYTLCFYQTALNLTPSSFMSYFMFLSFPFIKDRKLIRFLFFIVIGMLFHTSAIFFLPLYFLSNIKINKKTLSLVFCISALIFIFYPIFIKILINILPQSYVGYIDGSRGYRGNKIELLVLLVQIIAMAFCVIQVDKKKIKKIVENNNIVLWLLIYEVLLYLLSMKASMFQRGAFLFSPYVIIIVPNIICKIDSKNRRALTTVCMVIYGTILYLLRVHINNVGTTMPYVFFFND